MQPELQDDQQRRDDGADDQDDEHGRPIARVGGAEIRAADRARVAQLQIAGKHRALPALADSAAERPRPRPKGAVVVNLCIVRYGVT